MADNEELVKRLRKAADHAGIILTDPPRPTDEKALFDEAADAIEALSRRSPPAQEGMVLVPREPTEAVNIADAILRQVRRTLAAEDRHYTSSDPLHTRDEADLEYSRLVGFSLAQCDAALAVVRRRRAMIAAALAPASDAVKPGDET